MIRLELDDRSVGGFAEVAVYAAASDAVTALNQHPLEPLYTFTGGTLALALGGLGVRTAILDHRRRFRRGRCLPVVNIVDERDRQHAPLFPASVLDFRFDDAIVEAPGLNGILSIHGDADVPGAPHDQTGSIRNGGDGTRLLAQLEKAVGRLVRAAVGILGSHCTVLRPEEALDLSDAVSDHALLLDMLLVGAHPARSVMGGVMLCL